MSRRTVVAAIAVAGLACGSVAGCESSGSAPTVGPTKTGIVNRQSSPTRTMAEAPSTAQTGVCAFAQPADVAAAFGADPATVVVSSGRTGIGDAQCEFTLRATNVGRPGTVRLILRTNGTGAQLRRARLSTPDVRDVSGVGDAAFYDAARTTLAFIRKRSLISIQVAIRRPAEKQPKPSLVRRDILRLGRALADRI